MKSIKTITFILSINFIARRKQFRFLNRFSNFLKISIKNILFLFEYIGKSEVLFNDYYVFSVILFPCLYSTEAPIKSF